MKHNSAVLIGVLIGLSLAVVVAVLPLLSGVFATPAKASLFQGVCELYVPKGPWTFDVASNLFDVALRHEAGKDGIDSLSREDYTHAAQLVSDCVPK